MNPAIFVILTFSGLFTFAFGLAWLIPLYTARSKSEEPPTKQDWIFGSADLILVLLDCIPFFWLFRAIPEIPSTYTAARDKWRQDATVRGFFYMWLVSLAVFVIAVVVAFNL